MEHGPKRVVLMEAISSGEHFLFGGEIPRRVLDNITLLIRRAEVWGINGTSLFEIKLLLEIMANIRPYDKGKCVLIERGMMRRKRVILKHVFYIGSPDMLYINMNVLEFLMFATAKSKINKVVLQEQIFELIIATGLGHLSLTPNHMLTGEEKAVINLIAAAYSDSLMIVFNLPEYEWDEVLIDAVAKITSFIRERGKTLILATQNCLLIEKAGNQFTVDIDNYPPMSQTGAMEKTVTRQAVHGVYSGRNRWLGALILFANTIVGRLLFLLVPAILLYYHGQIYKYFKKDKKYKL